MEQENKVKQSVKSRFSVFVAGALLAVAGMLVSGSSWFVQFSQPVVPYVEKASEYAQKASEVSRDVVSGVSKSFGSASPGIATGIATSSTRFVGPDLNGAGLKTILFPKSSNCTSRIVSTVAQPIMLYWGTSAATAAGDATTTVTGQIGHVQAASTTISYDSGIYGCGPVGVYGFSASTTITVTEFQ